MCGDRFNSSITCSRWRHETEPGQLDPSLSCRFWKVATHPLLLLRVADQKQLPFTVRVPNTATVKAMKELDEGKGKRFGNAEELFQDLSI